MIGSVKILFQFIIPHQEYFKSTNLRIVSNWDERMIKKIFCRHHCTPVSSKDYVIFLQRSK